jgi:hypothetical protein
MKTKIFTTVTMLILASNLIAGTTNRIEKDTTTVLAYTAYEKSSFEIRSENNVVTREAIYVNNADILENWVATRESWEQEGVPGNSDLMETVNLEEWIASRESWEQKGSDNEITTVSVQSDILEIWVSERENWEQK